MPCPYNLSHSFSKLVLLSRLVETPKYADLSLSDRIIN
ncbi:hypothetical protein NIES2107_66130 [Nostoc carneum NIES-2107]|nr:hypothetical protein NIES2107_66130 [Nostoc carneum NIES-2107]